MRQLGLWLVLALGIAVVAVPTQADDKAKEDQTTGDKVSKLIEQLSSSRFADREKAHKALKEIGAPALEGLRKAAKGEDAETRKRAEELVAEIEKATQVKKVLAPKMVKLSYKDTPLKEAVEDLGKKSGYAITLYDPENKLKDRKVTLETKEVSFWEAFDQFCAKAGLVEGDGTEGQTQPGFPGGPAIDLPLVPVQPVPPPAQPPAQVKPIQVKPIQIQPIKRLPAVLPKKQIEKNLPVLPNEDPPKKDDAPAVKEALAVQVDEKDEAEARKREEAAKEAAEAAAKKKEEAKRAAIQAGAAKPAVIQIQVGGAAQPAIQIQPGRRPIRVPPQPFPSGQPGQLILKDGKAGDVPTSYSGAVRVRPMDNPTNIYGEPQKGELLFGLKVTPEPKITWQQTVAVRIDKALDDNGQELKQVMGMGNGGPVAPDQPVIGFGGGFPGGGPGRPGWAPWGGFGGLHQFIPVKLTKGEKASKVLKEVTGNITAQVLTEPEVHLTADDILKAAGKTFKGKDSGEFKITGIEEKNGQVVVRFEMTQPTGVVTAPGQGNIGAGVIEFPNIQILPVAPPQALPPQAAPALPGGLQVQAQAQPAQVKIAQIQIAPIQGGGGIAAPGFPGRMTNYTGVELLDEKGKAVPVVSIGQQGRGAPGAGAFTLEWVMVFKPEKDQKPAKLVYKGSKAVNVEIPFTLKDVKLP